MHTPRVKWLFIFVVIGLALVQTVTAAEKPYVVGPGDVLSVTVFAGGTVQESLDLAVSPKGTINFPFLGEIKAAGLTINQLSEATTGPLERDYFVNAQVIINIKDYKSKKVYITGAIEKPGLYALEGTTSLLELIAKAGGFTKDRGNIAYVLKGSMKEINQHKAIDQLVQEKKSIEVNLKELLDQGVTSRNIELEADDVVYIRPAAFSDQTHYKIYVLGKVEKPGAYDFQDGLTALDACILAGGFAKYAAPNRTVITRRESGETQQTININLDKVRKGEEKDIPLKPGDRIYVPESWF
jgi:polysaccharide export outer membrane protein